MLNNVCHDSVRVWNPRDSATATHATAFYKGFTTMPCFSVIARKLLIFVAIYNAESRQSVSNGIF
ncbi:hypothetical protein [Helicobacter rodentium]|uniref:hypothetical protein n=1 Tax=Helicobacter rodentium TaxID=59617 RepID=UPI000A789A21|nr:hypothetical protein [Helicobacter rodentium]